MSMPDIDEELRSLLADRANRAPTAVALLAGTKARSRQRLVRRRAALSGLTAVAVGASVTATPVLVSAVQGPRVGPDIGAPSATWTPSAPQTPTSGSPPAGGAQCSLEAVTRQPTVTFPFRPTVTPPGAPEAAVFSTNRVYLSHRRMIDDAIWISVDQRDRAPVPSDGAPNWAPSVASVQVRNRTATLASGESESGALLYLFWQEKPGLWLTVTAVGVDRTNLLRYADGLREEPLSDTEAYRFALLPAGLTIVESLHWSMVLGWLVDGQRNTDRPEFGVTVTSEYQPGPQAQPVRVGDLDGYLMTEGGARSVYVKRGEWWLQVIAPSLCTDADTVRMAAGITVDVDGI
jgi:hypothetical protein